MPALGFGTLIPDATGTRNATRTALEAGFRPFDCAERYRNEEQVGEAIREAIQAGVAHPRGLVYHDKAVEQQSSPRACPAGIRVELQQAAIGLYGSIPDPHPFCVSARRQPRPEGSKR